MTINISPDLLGRRGQLLTLDEVAKRLSISRARVYELINAGELELLHIGRLARVRESDLERYVAGLTRKAG
jgi:excisionase family DNA binding protein